MNWLPAMWCTHFHSVLLGRLPTLHRPLSSCCFGIQQNQEISSRSEARFRLLKPFSTQIVARETWPEVHCGMWSQRLPVGARCSTAIWRVIWRVMSETLNQFRLPWFLTVKEIITSYCTKRRKNSSLTEHWSFIAFKIQAERYKINQQKNLSIYGCMNDTFFFGN